MKSLLSPRNLKLLAPACGIVGLLLRHLLVATGTDGRGLIVPLHPAWIALWALTVAVMAAAMLGVRTLRGPAGWQGSFPRSPLAAAAGVPAAVCATMAAVRYFQTEPVITIPPNFMTTALFFLKGAVMVLAVLCFLLAGVCRLTDRKPHFLLHVVICIWFALEMLTLYQAWSFDPQLHEYCFQLFACIALTMTAYQLASFGIGKGSHRKLWFWALLAVYMCGLCLSSGLFFIAGAFWSLTALSTPRRRQRKTMETETPAAE